jgi:MerR family copper efflux transcriptional regulator
MPRTPLAPPAAAPEQILGPLRIGEVASRSGVSVKTIRFYCDQGLLQPSGRSAGGYRLFHADTLAELVIIRALRAMDVPIAELVRILHVRRAGVCNCALLKASINAKMEAIDLRMRELVMMKGELARLLQGWQECGGKKDEPAA